jgi:hypothetical protein
MAKKDIHMTRNINNSVSDLISTVKNEYPHFRNVNSWKAVERGGKGQPENVFHVFNAFSTNFPQMAVDAEQLVS